MSENNTHENKTEVLAEEAKKEELLERNELSMEELERVCGGSGVIRGGDAVLSEDVRFTASNQNN